MNIYRFYGHDSNGKLTQQNINAVSSYRAIKQVQSKRPDIKWNGYTENEIT